MQPPGWSPPERTQVSARLALGLAAAGIGLILVIAGSFLPWLASGAVLRNSYQISGIAGRLGILGGGPSATALRLWPFLGPLCFVPVILGTLRWWRVAGGVCALIGVLTGLLAGGLLIAAGGRTVAGLGVESSGPGTMLAGSLLLLSAGVVLMSVRVRSVALTRGHSTARSDYGKRFVSGELAAVPVRRTSTAPDLHPGAGPEKRSGQEGISAQ